MEAEGKWEMAPKVHLGRLPRMVVTAAQLVPVQIFRDPELRIRADQAPLQDSLPLSELDL